MTASRPLSGRPSRSSATTILEQEQGGWENNDGAFGEFTFDVAERTIELEFNGRFTDIRHQQLTRF